MKTATRAGYFGGFFGKNAGFTLIEALVAVGIVGTLASILIPTISKAKMRASQTMCMGNMKQLGVGFISYSHDNGRNVPYSSTNGNSGWVNMMKAYGITEQVLHCPMCDKNNAHSMGGMRKNWRVGNVPGSEKPEEGGNLPEGVVAANDEAEDQAGDQAGAEAASLWARHPNYWRFVAGNFGRGKEAVFSLPHVRPGCSEHDGKHNPHCKPREPYREKCPPWRMITPPPCPPPDLSPKSQGGSTVVLVMCENVKPSGFALKISDAKTGRRLDSLTGTSMDDWELFDWSGPLAKSLGGDGSLLSPKNPYHKKPIGFDQANGRGRKPLNQGKYYPDPPSGTGPVNYIYMRTTIRSKVDQDLEISVTGDDAYSVFVLRGSSGCSSGPGTPCEKGEPTTSSYGINAFVQSKHHHSPHEPHKFVEVSEQLTSSIPLFAEANWAWVMPSPYDLPPNSLDGGFSGIQRVILNRHSKRINMVYGDGHAEAVQLRDLYEQEWYPGCKMMRGMRPPKLPDY